MSDLDRLTGPIDGVLHLLDRQLIDSEGAFLGKVDDVELSGHGREPVVVLGILTGPAAEPVERWGQMRVSEPDRTRPWRIEIGDVERLDSALHLSVRRVGVLRRDHDADHRLGRLAGMSVVDPDGSRRGRVLDARFEPDHDGRLVMCSLIVGRGRPGSILGYDRREEQGPWLVRAVVRWLHRHTVIVAAEDAEIDWAAATVHLRSTPTERPGHPFD